MNRTLTTAALIAILCVFAQPLLAGQPRAHDPAHVSGVWSAPGDGHAGAPAPAWANEARPWRFFTNGVGNLAIQDEEVQVVLINPGTNAQVFQMNIALDGDTEYRLTFTGSTNRGQDVDVVVRKHGAPYTPYGLMQRVNLGTDENDYEIVFTTTPGDKVDARLQFYFTPYDRPGDWYEFENVVLEKMEAADEEDDDFVGHACTRHAGLLRRACLADRKDDFLVHIADCIYVTPAEDEQECRAEARDEADEKADECEEVYEGRVELCELVGEGRYADEFDPADFVDPDDIGDSVDPNPYWPLHAGHTHVIVADGEVTVVTATDEVREVGGLPCRVIRDLVFEEGIDDEGEVEYEGVEVTQDWYAQHVNGDVIYCGENTYEVEDGLIDNTDGSFANGRDRARAGVLLRAAPVVGQGDRQEMATDEAEDYVEYVSLASGPSEEEGGEGAFPCNGACLQTLEVNPHDPGQAEHKYYLPGIGFVLATKLDENGDATGEREEVSCIGESLDVLDDPSCGIADPDALRDALCLWAPEALCLD